MTEEEAERIRAEAYAANDLLLDEEAMLRDLFYRLNALGAAIYPPDDTQTRRPGKGLSLFIADDERIRFTPGWDRRKRVVDLDCWVAAYEVRPDGAWKVSSSWVVTKKGARVQRLCFRGHPERTITFVERSRSFGADPLTELNRASCHCCICGKHLHVTSSLCRGIGPDCFAQVGKLLLGWHEEFERREAEGVARTESLAHAEPVALGV